MISRIMFAYLFGACAAVIIDTSDSLFRDPYKIYESKGYHRISYHPPARSYNIYHDTFAYPKYEYEYAVSDKKTGDHKYHHEARDGHRVRGGYGLVEPDGSVRKVTYDADDHNGFHAVVSKSTNMHGDNAFSMMGHARHFSPFGSGVKINHYFPKKQAGMNQVITTTELVPVTEANESVKEKNEEDNAITDAAIKENNDNDNTTEKMKAELVMKTEDNIEMDPMKIGKMEANDLVKEMPTPIAMVQNQKEEAPAMPVTESITALAPADAEGASSFYHSRMYFLTY